MKPLENTTKGLIIAIAFAITLAVLWLGQDLIYKWQVKEPLQKDFFEVKEVQKIKVVPGVNEGVLVLLELKRVKNLQNILELVERRVAERHQKTVMGFRIQSNPNALLEEARYQLSFYWEEALARGRFIQLKKVLAEFEAVQAKIYLGEKYLYLQLEDQKHFLYQAIPRKDYQRGQNSVGEVGAKE